MNRQERRSEMKKVSDALKDMSKDLKFYYDGYKQQAEIIKRQAAELEKARTLVSQLTNQVKESGRSYMHTLAAIAKANGGEFRIPGSAIDSVRSDDIIENRLDDIRDEIVFTIKSKGSETPSGIILPGRSRR